MHKESISSPIKREKEERAHLRMIRAARMDGGKHAPMIHAVLILIDGGKIIP